MKHKNQGIGGKPGTKIVPKGKNKKIKKIKSVPDTNSNSPLPSESTLNYAPQLQESVPDTLALRQYKQELNLVKDFMREVADSYDFDPKNISEQIDSSKSQFNFPSISIDRLFDQKELILFSDTFVSNDVSDYLKLVINQGQQKRKKIIITMDGDSLLLSQDFNRQQDSQEFKGRFISLLEREVLQNRPNFIEKIKLNQSKYQDCNSHLSELSQELLFLSKIYLENTSQIKKLAEKLTFPSVLCPKQTQTETVTQKFYHKIIIKKNILFAIKPHQIDFFNYFRKKQHEQRTFYTGPDTIKNEDEFFSYLKSKKPKKGKLAKYCLLTACSCCFSGYFETYNPLIPCENCNLRSHKLCYNLKQNTCGNCSYQRLLKSDKQLIPHCIICKQKGEMTIKLKDKLYAHAFCLIVHNQCQIAPKNLICLPKNQLQKDPETYYNKIPKSSHSSNQCLKFHEKNFSLLFQDISQKFAPRNTFHEPPKIILQNQNSEINSQFVDEEKGTEIERNAKKVNSCEICREDLYEGFYGSCIRCGKKTHIFCAFFEGCKLEENDGNMINLVLDCCSESCEEREKQKKAREYVLNRNRFLFEGI